MRNAFFGWGARRRDHGTTPPPRRMPRIFRPAHQGRATLHSVPLTILPTSASTASRFSKDAVEPV